MVGDIDSTAEVGVMLRDMADAVGRLAAGEFPELVDARLREVVKEFEPSVDVETAEALIKALAAVISRAVFEAVQERIAEAHSRAGAK